MTIPFEDIRFETVCVSPGLWKTYAIGPNGERLNGWASDAGPLRSFERAYDAVSTGLVAGVEKETK